MRLKYITARRYLPIPLLLALVANLGAQAPLPGPASASGGGSVNGMVTNAANALTSAGTIDASAASSTTGLKVPTAAGAVPALDGSVANNSTNHVFAWGSNGTTIVGAAAATGTGTATTCTNQFVRAVSSLAAPTCNSIALADTPLTTRGDLLVANSTPALARLAIGAANTVLHGSATDPAYSSVVAGDIAANTITSGQVNGSIATVGLTTQTTTYNAAATDNIILCNSTTAFTVTLPTAAVTTGKPFTVKNINTGTCTVAVAGGVNIDGGTTYLLTTQYQAASFAYDGAQYWLF